MRHDLLSVTFSVRQRDDIKNHWAALKGLTAKIDADEITDYLDALFDGASDPETRCDTGNVAIDSVVNYKLRDMQNTDIRLTLRLRVPPVLQIADADTVTIIGNLLDNALEAVAKTPPPAQKTLKLSVALDNDVLVIKTENTFNGEIREVGDKSQPPLKTEATMGTALKT